MTIAPLCRELGRMVSLEKGTPPVQQPYFGQDAELYLTPEYLRRGTTPKSVKVGLRAVRIDEGDTIVLWDGSNAGEVLRGRPGVLASTMTRLKPFDSFDPRYLFYAVKRWEPFLKSHTAGSGIPHVDKELLGKIQILEFTKSEQIKIAEILSTVDGVIERGDTLLAKQVRIKMGLIRDLLTHGIDEHGQIRSEDTHIFKNSRIGRIPAEWEVKRIDELLADVDPAMRSGPFGSALRKEELVESGIPLLGIDNVFPEEFVRNFSRFVDPKKAETLQRYRVRPGDLMVTIMGTVGRCCVVPNDTGFALSSKHTWTISLDRKRYSPYLACLQINYAPWVLRHFAQDEQGGIMAAIKSSTLRSTMLPVPHPDEMKLIEQRMRAISDVVQRDANIVAKLRSLRVGLMEDLLTGRKRVTRLLKPASRASAQVS